MNATKDEIIATIETVRAIADAIKELNQVPSGVLYTAVMAKMDLPTFQRIVETLKRAGLVTESNHVLTWHQPKEVL